MTEAIYNNQKSIEVLNQLVEQGIYKGVVKQEVFNLKYNTYTYRLLGYRIQGTLDDQKGRYYLKVKFVEGAEVFFLTAALFFILIIIPIAVYMSWLVLLIVPVLVAVLYFRDRRLRREMLDMFIAKYSHFYDSAQ